MVICCIGKSAQIRSPWWHRTLMDARNHSEPAKVYINFSLSKTVLMPLDPSPCPLSKFTLQNTPLQLSVSTAMKPSTPKLRSIISTPNCESTTKTRKGDTTHTGVANISQKNTVGVLDVYIVSHIHLTTVHREGICVVSIRFQREERRRLPVRTTSRQVCVRPRCRT